MGGSSPQNLLFSKLLLGAIASVSILLKTWEHWDMTKDRYKSLLMDKEDVFEFIIGGGTAGLVLAARLSEQFKVLVLEAGGDPHFIQSIPNYAYSLINQPEVDWIHRTIPNKHTCLALPFQQSTWSAGKGLGGTSNINFNIHLRGNPNDYDSWARITGDPGWSYERVLPYFIKSEHFLGLQGHSKEYHGIGGLLGIEIPDFVGLAKEWIFAGKQFNVPHVDLNGKSAEGFDTIYHESRNGQRDGVYNAYLTKDIRSRANLYIYKYSFVNKILFEGANNKAYAVVYERHNKRKKAFAKKEIILSAGTVNSPKLLMLSGVGPASHLEEIGIPLVKDLPAVGQNVQDHLGTLVGPFFIDEPEKTIMHERDIGPSAYTQYLRGKGPLTSSGPTGAALLSSSWARNWFLYGSEFHWTDIQLLLEAISIDSTFLQNFARARGVREDILKKFLWEAMKKESFFITAGHTRPKSRGYILLKNRNPHSEPFINPNYLDSHADLQVLIEAAQISLKIVENSTSFQQLGATFYKKPFPGCEHYPFKSDSYWGCYIRHMSISLNHYVGSCSMGPGGRFDSVVDPNLKVIGTVGLRVVDASIMPTVVSNSPQAAVIMIAERAGDIIKRDWEYKKNGWNSYIVKNNIPDVANMRSALKRNFATKKRRFPMRNPRGPRFGGPNHHNNHNNHNHNQRGRNARIDNFIEDTEPIDKIDPLPPVGPSLADIPAFPPLGQVPSNAMTSVPVVPMMFEKAKVDIKTAPFLGKPVSNVPSAQQNSNPKRQASEMKEMIQIPIPNFNLVNSIFGNQRSFNVLPLNQTNYFGNMGTGTGFRLHNNNGNGNSNGNNPLAFGARNFNVANGPSKSVFNFASAAVTNAINTRLSQLDRPNDEKQRIPSSVNDIINGNVQSTKPMPVVNINGENYEFGPKVYFHPPSNDLRVYPSGDDNEVADEIEDSNEILAVLGSENIRQIKKILSENNKKKIKASSPFITTTTTQLVTEASKLPLTSTTSTTALPISSTKLTTLPPFPPLMTYLPPVIINHKTNEEVINFPAPYPAAASKNNNNNNNVTSSMTKSFTVTSVKSSISSSLNKSKQNLKVNQNVDDLRNEI